MTTELRVLVVEDSDDDYQILLHQLRKGGYQVSSLRIASAEELDAELAKPWQLVITDWLMPGFGGLTVLETLAGRAIDLPCIVVSGTANEETAVAALRAGALDFLSKDKPLRIVPAVERALREASERRARVVAERELRDSEARYRAAFEHAPEAIVTYDLDRPGIEDANAAALQLFGRSLDELRAAPPGTLAPPKRADGRDSVSDAHAMRARALAGEPVQAEIEIAHPSGEVIPVEMRSTTLPAAGRHLIRITYIDLRERRRVEELRRRSIELELQNRRIQEANRLKSEFLANMSHELRTPLNAIIGFAELLHDGHVDPRSVHHKEFLGDILSSGRHLLQLINDVLDLAKVEAGKLDFRPEPVDLGKLVAEVVATTRVTAAEKRIAVATAIDPALATGVVLDPSRFKQIVFNYLSNALKFTGEGGRVEVRLVGDGADRFRLEVEDNGVGIEPAQQGRLFVEFQQLEVGSAKHHQGTGLGLALTRRLVEAQGGSVGLRSTPGQGSVFHAVLPRHARIAVGSLVLPRTANRSAARTVLVVEDDARDRDVVAATLLDAGYAIEVASTGAEALARCAQRTFDAITLDLILPDTSGFDLLAALRADERTRATPVIVVSVAPQVGIVAGFAVEDVLRKPLDRAQLLAALERAGVRPDRHGGILVVDDDGGALKMMDVTLAQLGYSAIVRSTGASGLRAAEELHPKAVVLDLLMPEMDGVEFLDRFRRLPEHARTPVLIWTMKELTEAERAKLRESAQAIVSKNGGTPSTVVAQLRVLLDTAEAR